MDKSSPVFENFENKMSAMQGQGGPKINRSTFKTGSGGLQTRVANNEKKISTLKNILKTNTFFRQVDYIYVRRLRINFSF